MKKLLAIIFVFFFICPILADNWKQAQKDQDEYLAMRAKSQELFAAKEYEKYSALMLKISQCAHGKRFLGVHAWGLNNAGYGYLLAGKPCEAIYVLEKAIAVDYANAEWRKIVRRNYSCAEISCKK